LWVYIPKGVLSQAWRPTNRFDFQYMTPLVQIQKPDDANFPLMSFFVFAFVGLEGFTLFVQIDRVPWH
jgi:hypothetical protein